MTPATRHRPHPLRLWWALPGLAVVSTAIALAVVVGPTLGEHVSIPRQLVVPATATTVAPAQTVTHAVHPRRHPSPKPTLTATPGPSSAPAQTHVVSPRRPVVTAPGDDSHEHESGPDPAGVETQGTDR